MMQPAGGIVQQPMGPQQNQMPPPPPMLQQGPPPPPQQQWGVIPPPLPQQYQQGQYQQGQYQQGQYHMPQQQPQQPAPMWNQPQSQIPPPQMPQTYPQQQYPAPAHAPVSQLASIEENRTLWIGDLQPWMDQNYLAGCFSYSGEVPSVKLIRDKTGQPQSYGFIEFTTRATTERVLQMYNGTMMPNSDQTFRLNWATYSAGERRDDTPEYTIFVGDLSSDVTDYILQETFRAVYPSVKGAKVVLDKSTGHSRGYGFVKFGDANEQSRAMTEMNGRLCTSRPMRIGAATTKKTMGTQQNVSNLTSQGTQSESDPNNTTIFVGGLDPNVSEEVLRQAFSQFGELVHVKIPLGKRCGFVQFANRACAEEALVKLQGTTLGAQNVRLSWGRSPSNKQPQQDPNQWNGSFYGYGQGYEAYGYTQPSQDPNMYSYGTYPGYVNYQQQQ